MSERIFRKSSYSDDIGGACVEAGVPEGIVFKKSSYSGDQPDMCVEMGISDVVQAVLVRDSKFESGSPLIETSPQAFTAFVGAIAAHELAPELV